jgi:hypothetical protein
LIFSLKEAKELGSGFKHEVRTVEIGSTPLARLRLKLLLWISFSDHGFSADYSSYSEHGI